MKDLASLLGTPEQILKRIERNYQEFEASENDPKKRKKFWWEAICRHLFPEEWQESKSKIFRKVMGQTSQFTLEEIKGIFESSIRWRKNPPALFWKLVKDKRAEIKETVNIPIIGEIKDGGVTYYKKTAKNKG